MKLPAPAKVNLHLRLLGRRADGFHNLETLMVPVSLADEIQVESAPGGEMTVTCDDPDIPLGEDNLVARAAGEFFRHTGRVHPVRIHIVKRIPMGAGLGGGSSDAATTLMVLNKIFAAGLAPETLRELAGGVGSDVPFFIHPQPAWCRGRGEIIDATELPENLSLLLVKPPFGVETPWAYRNWGEKSWEVESQDLGWVELRNDLEGPVFEKFLVLPVLKQWLIAQPEVRVAAMSGSGSTLFAVLKNGAAGEDLEARTKAYFGGTFWTALCQSEATGAWSGDGEQR